MPEKYLIDKARLLSDIWDDLAFMEGAPVSAKDAAKYLDDLVHKQPTIEPEVRHGRWIPVEFDSYADGEPVWDKYECSECGHEHSGEEDTLTAFCPNCGAKMDERLEEEK